MKKLTRFSLAALILGAAFAPTAEGVMISDRAAWETAVGTWTDVNEGQIPTGGAALPGNQITLPSGTTVAFSSGAGYDIVGYAVPSEWQTWSGSPPPPSRVLAATGNSAITALASGPLNSFGLEMEPFQFDLYEITLFLENGSFLTQTVDGSGGAAFFGWANEPVVAFYMLSADPNGFAFGRMVEGPGAPAPVPDGGSLTLATGLLWAGLIVIRRKCGQRRDDHVATA